MSKQGPEVEQSLEQALRGDLRVGGTESRTQEALRQGTLPDVAPTRGSESKLHDPQKVQAVESLLSEAERVVKALTDKDLGQAVAKLAQVQASLQELLRAKIAQYISLSVKTRGLTPGEVRMLISEGIAEVANLHQLSGAQRALLEIISVSVATAGEGLGEEAPDLEPTSDLEQPAPTPSLQMEEEILIIPDAMLRRVEGGPFEEVLARDVVEESPETTPDPVQGHSMPRDLEAQEVHVIDGIVVSQRSQSGVPGVVVYGGTLGTAVTDAIGRFSFANVPHGTMYAISVSRKGYVFEPSVRKGSLLMSMSIDFVATKEPM